MGQDWAVVGRGDGQLRQIGGRPGAVGRGNIHREDGRHVRTTAPQGTGGRSARASGADRAGCSSHALCGRTGQGAGGLDGIHAPDCGGGSGCGRGGEGRGRDGEGTEWEHSGGEADVCGDGNADTYGKFNADDDGCADPNADANAFVCDYADSDSDRVGAGGAYAEG